ncbi:MAG: tetratricopeptide repeat protein, partial [Desulfobulbales bacterium]|nr:tetratricopeptide repeat protein [Desulfobulbales bacterium]
LDENSWILTDQDEQENKVMSEKMVKQDFMIVVALVALVVGFLVGVVFSSLQSAKVSSPVARQQSAPPPGQTGSGITSDQANQILSFEREVAANPENLQAWTSLGHIYFDTNRVTKAINAYNKSLELDPDNANVWTDLGVMYRRNKEPYEAIKAFDRAISLSPTHEQSRFNKGVVMLYDLNDKAGARKAWEELLTVNPGAMTPNGQPVGELIATIE